MFMMLNSTFINVAVISCSGGECMEITTKPTMG
jgi:hypothetical protein